MIKFIKKSDCSGCYSCTSICPKQCISMKTDNEGFWYPQIDKDICINCRLCEKACPIINKIDKDEKQIVSYACKNKDNETRNTSSSGGVFSLLCEYVISKNGVVFGAAFNEKFEVNHMCAETLEECEKLKGSKYVQSKIGNTYRQAKEFLEDGRIILFSGTPCQISGLSSFLMKKYDNLIMIDIACHGVPSPLVYKNYIQSLENNNNSNISLFSFRDKSTGWKNYSLKVDFNNKKQVKEIGYNNIYMKGFLNDIYLRPSCYECKFKKPTTSVDITLADYWGVQNIHPEFDDDKGISLVLVNTKKGQEVFNAISFEMDFIKTDLDYAISCNPCIVRPVKYNPKRKKFFEKLGEDNIEKVIKKYTEVGIVRRVIKKIKDLLIKIS